MFGKKQSGENQLVDIRQSRNIEKVKLKNKFLSVEQSDPHKGIAANADWYKV